MIDPSTIDVVAPNFKRHLSGVTSTIVQLIPHMRASGLGIAAMGPGLPPGVARLSFADLPRLWRRPAGRPFRIWHARRNNEMIVGLLLRDVLRMPMRLVFTSAAQRHHRPTTNWMLRRMDAVVATSGRSAAYIDVAPVVIPHGVDVERFHPPATEADSWSSTGLPGRYGIGCFGRVRELKGTDLFVDAMIELLPLFPDWTAVIAGRVTPEHAAFAERLKARIKAAGLSERIVLLGEVGEIAPWYRRISLYVAPSRNEGFGLTPIEAMASGRPVVASDSGAYADMVEQGSTGAIVPVGDGAALREAIRPYLADPALAEKHGAAALLSVRAAFSLDREADSLMRLYQRLWGET